MPDVKDLDDEFFGRMHPGQFIRKVVGSITGLPPGVAVDLIAIAEAPGSKSTAFLELFERASENTNAAG